MDLKKNYEMKLYDWNASLQTERYYFLLFIFVVFLLTANYYYVLVAHKTVYIVNLYAIIFSLKLFRITNDTYDVVLKMQILQMISLAILLIVLSFLPIPLWIVVTINNFFAIVYFGFFYLHRREYKEKYVKIKPYVHIIHFFFLIYLCLLNVQIYFWNHELKNFITAVNYIQVCIQCFVLVISIFTYLYITRRDKEEENTTFSVSKSQLFVEVTEEKMEVGRKSSETETYRLKYKNQELAEQILEFFEEETVYLKSDFTMEMLCNAIPNSTLQMASFVINNHLNTTFYKLVAYHRILYSLRLLVNQPDWTILAIAEECGFRSVNTFNKYFKDLTGFSPVEYRGVIEKSKVKL